MKLIDSKLHRYLYRKLILIEKNAVIVKMKGLTHALVDISGQRYNFIGLPEREVVRWSRRFYYWPYFHGYLIDPIIVGWRWVKNFFIRK